MLVSTSCSAVQNIRRHCQAEVEENPSSVFPSMCTPPPPPATRPRPANASERPGPILFCAHANPKPKTPALPRAHLEALAGRTGLACAMKTPAPSRHACFACSVQSAARASRFMFCSRPLCSAAGLYVLQPASMFCSSPEPGKPSPRAHGIIRCSNRNCHISLHEMVHGIHPNVPATQPLASAFQHTTRTPSMHQRGLAKRGQRTR